MGWMQRDGGYACAQDVWPSCSVPALRALSVPATAYRAPQINGDVPGSIMGMPGTDMDKCTAAISHVICMYIYREKQNERKTKSTRDGQTPVSVPAARRPPRAHVRPSLEKARGPRRPRMHRPDARYTAVINRQDSRHGQYCTTYDCSD